MSRAGLRRRVDRLESPRRSVALVPESPDAAARRDDVQPWLDVLLAFDLEGAEAGRFPRVSAIGYRLAVAFDGPVPQTRSGRSSATRDTSRRCVCLGTDDTGLSLGMPGAPDRLADSTLTGD